jgi:hypothetical protein
MPGFMQIMEVKTSRFDELKDLLEKMQAERGDTMLATRSTFTADRDRPGYYFAVIEFNSYEEAMKNSNDPATTEFVQKAMGALLDEPPRYRHLDVLRTYEK